MPRHKLKNTADGTFAFRIKSSDKKTLQSDIERIRASLNKQIGANEYSITANEIVTTAIKLGLQKLKLSDLPKRRQRLNIGE